MKTLCPKCQSGNVYYQEGEWACMMCGKRWYPERKVVMSRIAVCMNCGCETSIVAKDLCGVCYTAVHNKFEEGTAEYKEALKKALERCTGLVTAPAKRKGRPKKEASSTVAAEVTEDSSIVASLKAKRDELMDKVFKLNQAIEVIEAL